MMNYVFPVLIVFSFVCAAVTGQMNELSASVVEGGTNAVELIIRLVSMLCLWGGIMEIADKAGVTAAVSKLLSPVGGYYFGFVAAALAISLLKGKKQ